MSSGNSSLNEDLQSDCDYVEVHAGHKVGALMFMAAATIIVALMPIYVRKKIISSSSKKWNEILLSALVCFGAGNLIGVTFIHILPDTRAYIDDAKDLDLIPDMDFPLAEVLICVGFFLVYLIEDMVHECVGHHHHEHKDENKTINNNVEGGKKGEEFNNGKEKAVTDNKAEPTLMKGEHTTVIHAVTVVTALSVHDVLEGFSIGLAESVDDVWLLAIVLVIHKLILAFSVGMELLQEGVKLIPYMAAQITFALATPLGGLIGIASHSAKDATALGIMLPAVLNGLSGGCIVFVLFCEMIERERRPHGSPLRIISIILGFALIAGLALLPH